MFGELPEVRRLHSSGRGQKTRRPTVAIVLRNNNQTRNRIAEGTRHYILSEKKETLKREYPCPVRTREKRRPSVEA